MAQASNSSNGPKSPIESLRSLVLNNDFAPIPKWGFEIGVAFPTSSGPGEDIVLIPENQIFPALEFTAPSIGSTVSLFSYTGLQKPHPLKKEYSNFSITLPLMNDFAAYNAFLGWRDSLFIDFGGASFVRDYGESLTGNVSVYMFDRVNRKNPGKAFKLTFTEAFPAEILPIGFSQYEMSSIQTFTINFAFKDYKKEIATDHDP